MSKKRAITDLTRRNIFDYLSLEKVVWAGRLDEPDFVVRVWPDATKLSSGDHRYHDALSDIYQHRVNNFDWEDDWIFTHRRFNLSGCDDALFLSFLARSSIPSFAATIERQAQSGITRARRSPIACGMKQSSAKKNGRKRLSRNVSLSAAISTSAASVRPPRAASTRFSA